MGFEPRHTRSATLVVAASDSRDTANADYVCDGTDDQVEINSAITALGTARGAVVLLEGTFNTTGPINMASNIALVGQGAGTVLRIPDGTNGGVSPTAPFSVISASSVNRVLVQDLRIDGNRANQTAGYMNGIYFVGVTYSKIVGCWVENMRHHGIYLYTSSNNNTITGNTCLGNGFQGIVLAASNNNTVTGNTCQGNSLYGIYISSSSNNTVTGNTCQGNYLTGIDLDTANNNTVTGNTCLGNSFYGIYLSFSSNNNTVTGNTCQGNGWIGIYLDTSSNNTVTGNTCQGNDYYGIYLATSSNNTVTDNTCQGNDLTGIVLTSSNSNSISGNTVTGNSQLADNTYDGIYIDSDSDYNNIQGNTVRHAGGANQHRYGIRINNANCDGNFVHGNDLYNAGRTADYSDAGTATIYHNTRTTVGWVP